MDLNVCGFYKVIVFLLSEPPSVMRFANAKVSQAEIPSHSTATSEARSSHRLLAQKPLICKGHSCSNDHDNPVSGSWIKTHSPLDMNVYSTFGSGTPV